MNLLFKDITRDNWEECIELKISKDQKGFVASNSYSILEAFFNESLHPLAIYDGDTMVGFIMYEKDDIAHDFGMCRLMIDVKYQNKGYGREAVLKLIDFIKDKYGSTPLFTSVKPDNTVARKLYEGVGFFDTGKMLGDEVLLRMDL